MTGVVLSVGFLVAVVWLVREHRVIAALELERDDLRRDRDALAERRVADRRIAARALASLRASLDECDDAHAVTRRRVVAVRDAAAAGQVTLEECADRLDAALR